MCVQNVKIAEVFFLEQGIRFTPQNDSPSVSLLLRKKEGLNLSIFQNA